MDNAHKTHYLLINTWNTYNPQIVKIESEKTLWKQQQQQQQQVHLHQLVVVEENDVTSTLVEIILLEQKRKLRNWKAEGTNPDMQYKVETM